MRTATSKLLLLACALLTTHAVRAQRSPMKFGDLSDEHLQATVCPIDSNAHAYFIFDYGFSYFHYGSTTVRAEDVAGTNKGFQLYFTRHFRIKVLDQEGLDWADFAIPLYRNLDEESVGKIKAFTYNVVDGNVEKSKLDPKDVFVEETSEHWKTQKFAMPNVQAGSIIEVQYTILSDFFYNLRTWDFQKSIPVLYSEYNVHIPEYYTFNHFSRGYFPIETAKEIRTKKITITTVESNSMDNFGRRKYTSNYEYLDHVTQYKAANIPAFPVESYLRTADNYLSRIEFEIMKIQFPSGTPEYYTTTWSAVDERLLEDEDFGRSLNHRGHLKDLAMIVQAGSEDPEARLHLAFALMQSKMNWNGENRYYASEKLDRSFRDGVGNSADVNLNLIALLRETGFEAYPVVLSTQQNGIVHPSHPSLSQFNYVVALVKRDDGFVLLDATDREAEINLLPVRCLNDKGRVIGAPGLEWVNLMDHKPYRYTSSCQLILDQDLSVRGKTTVSMADYASYLQKKRIASYENLEAYEVALDEDFEDGRIEHLEVKGLDTTLSAVTLQFDVSREGLAEDAGGILYFSPIVDPFFDSNPFKLDKREYPVEFDHPYTIMQSYYIALPEGYRIEEVPAPFATKLPDNSAVYRYQVTPSGSGLMVNTVLNLRKSQYLPEEYEGLKMFLQLVIDKQEEMVVLSKS
ncbi:MAG: DUF3857 domain-containing protein [Bacteroidales bacterium]